MKRKLGSNEKQSYIIHYLNLDTRIGFICRLRSTFTTLLDRSLISDFAIGFLSSSSLDVLIGSRTDSTTSLKILSSTLEIFSLNSSLFCFKGPEITL